MSTAADDLTVLRNRTFDELAVGDGATIERTLTMQDIQLFALQSGDVNPQHVDPAYAASTRFHGVIAHGMWGGALISGVLGTRLPGPGTIYLEQDLRFLKPVRLGDTLQVGVTVAALEPATRQVLLDCRCVNQYGDCVIEGRARVIAPDQRVERPRTSLPELRLETAGGDGARRLLEYARKLGAIRMAVVHPCNVLSLGAALAARDAG
uniref:MaoC/PaaZ C-terminal domain-containing protein n=1 Tax=Tahibacter caeni TaxID=1453545 RepID=UPI0021495854